MPRPDAGKAREGVSRAACDARLLVLSHRPPCSAVFCGFAAPSTWVSLLDHRGTSCGFSLSVTIWQLIDGFPPNSRTERSVWPTRRNLRYASPAALGGLPLVQDNEPGFKSLAHKFILNDDVTGPCIISFGQSPTSARVRPLEACSFELLSLEVRGKNAR